MLVIGGVGAGGIPLGTAELFKLFDKGTPCDQATDCQSGSCVDGVCCNAVCTSPCNACSVRQDLSTGLLTGSTIPGTCEPVNGVMCNDGDACTRTDVCQGGSCVGNDPVTCTVPDSCTEAVCDKTTGVCSKPTNKPDTLACDDGNPCTTQDTCQEALAASATPPPAERKRNCDARNNGAYNAAPQLECCGLQHRRYGEPNESVVEDRTFQFGVTSTRPDRLTPPDEQVPAQRPGSRCVYQRVNLRALSGDELLSRGPPALWPLVALTRDGRGEAMIQKVLEAIERRPFRTSAERADHLAVLWFVAEAEDVPVRVLRAYISEERLMESTLYQSAFAKGEATGEARGKFETETRMCVETILRVLAHRTGTVDPTVAARLRAVSSLETLRAWHEQALLAIDAEGARRLAEKIQEAPLP